MRSSQVSRIALYWAPLTLAISIIWSILLNALGVRGLLPAISLAGPAIIAAACAVAVYYVHDHLVFDMMIVDISGKEEEKKWICISGMSSKNVH